MGIMIQFFSLNYNKLLHVLFFTTSVDLILSIYLYQETLASKMESIYRFATILLAILVVEASTSHRPPPIIEDLDDRGGMHEVRRAEHLAGDQGDVGDDNLGDLAYDGYDDSDDDSDDEAESGDYLDPMAHVGPVLDNEVDWKKLGKLGKIRKVHMED